MSNRVRDSLKSFSILLAYAILTIIITWPVFTRLGSYIPGNEGDAWEHLWTFRWVRDSLFAGRSPFYTDLLFHPQGVSLTNHNIAWFNIALWLPLQALFNEAAAYSIAFLLVIVFNGFAVFLLARDITKSEAAAFVAGIIGAFWPNILSHPNHPNLILIFWVPLAMLYIKRTLEKQRISDALIAAIFVALIGISRWQMLVISGILIVGYVLYLIRTKSQYQTRNSLKLILITGIVAFLIMLPLLWPVLSSQINREDAGGIVATNVKSNDLLLFVRPSLTSPIWGQTAIAQFFNQLSIQGLFVFFIGLIPLILIIYGAVTNWQQTRFWFLIGLVYFVFALGPELVINGKSFVPMPYRWIYPLTPFNLIGNPDRYVVVLVIPIAIMAAIGMDELLKRVPSRLHKAGIILTLTILIFLEYSSEFPILSMEVPNWYLQLAEEDGDFAILDLPIKTRIHDEFYMHYQFIHGKKLVGGKVSRPPPEAYSFMDSIPMLEKTNGGQQSPENIARVSEQFNILEQENVRYLILHKHRLDKEVLVAWQSWLDLTPIFEDKDLAVYETTWQVGKDIPLLPTNIPEIGLVSTSITPRSAVRGGWENILVRWGTLTGLNEEYDICLDIVNEEGASQWSKCQPLSPEWPTNQWRTNEVVDATYSIDMDQALPSGKYDVMATIFPVSADIFSGEPFLIDQVQLEVENEVKANWEELISLSQYDFEVSDSWLHLTIEWKAEQPIDVSYKVFVHVIDQVGGEIVAQEDFVPRDWSYPTYEWQKGELVEDNIILSMDGVAPGEYSVYIGFYDPATGQRLVSYDANGERYPDEAVLLSSFKH